MRDVVVDPHIGRRIFKRVSRYKLKSLSYDIPTGTRVLKVPICGDLNTSLGGYLFFFFENTRAVSLKSNKIFRATFNVHRYAFSSSELLYYGLLCVDTIPPKVRYVQRLKRTRIYSMFNR